MLSLITSIIIPSIVVNGSSINARSYKIENVVNMAGFSLDPTCSINSTGVEKIKYLAQAKKDSVSEQLDTLFEKIQANQKRKEIEENAKAKRICQNINFNTKDINTPNQRKLQWCNSRGYGNRRIIDMDLPSSKKRIREPEDLLPSER